MNRLKELREAAELSAQQLADKIDCSDSQITRLERSGKRNVGLEFAERAADFFGVQIHDVFPRPTEGA